MRDRIAARLSRHETWRHAASLMLGLMADLGRKNCWSIAEHRGDRTPHGLQHLLSRAVWDADGVRDDLRTYVRDHLGHDDAVLVVDETGNLKRGNQAVGVQRQYNGTAGRVENAQVAVYLAYSAPAGHTLIDRALYRPQGWVDDPDYRPAAAPKHRFTPSCERHAAAGRTRRRPSQGRPVAQGDPSAGHVVARTVVAAVSGCRAALGRGPRSRSR